MPEIDAPIAQSLQFIIRWTIYSSMKTIKKSRDLFPVIPFSYLMFSCYKRRRNSITSPSAEKLLNSGRDGSCLSSIVWKK